MRLAIVILNWNGKKLLEQFLPTLVKYSSVDNTQIYVADNASSDDSIFHIRKHFPFVNIIQHRDNLGFALGYNKALQKIDAQIFALVNSDIQVTKNWIKPILNRFYREPKTGAIQPKIKSYTKKNAFEYAGAAGGYIDSLGYAFCRGRIFNVLEDDTGQYNDSKEVFWVSGACMFIRSEIFLNLKGFDIDYFAHYEEIDLCWRMQNIGYKAIYEPESLVYHIGGATLNNSDSKKTYLNIRNSLYTLVKNLPKNRIIPIIFLRMILDGLTIIKFLSQGKFKHIIAIIRAHLSFYKNYTHMYKKRGIKFIKNYAYTTSIVISYFIKRKRYFNKL